MYYYKLIPFFGNDRATKFYLNRKFTGQEMNSTEWEKFGSLVKDYHSKTDLKQFLPLLKTLDDDFEIKIIKENFKILHNGKNITSQNKLWKNATDIIPHQTFHKNKIIYQGYNKNHFHNKINLKNFLTQSGGSNFTTVKHNYEKNILNKHELNIQKSIFDNLINNFDGKIKNTLTKNFHEYFMNLTLLQKLLTNMDELVELTKDNIDNNISIKLFETGFPNINDLITLQEKEKLLKNKVNQQSLKLQKIFRNVGIFDLQKYGIKL